MHSRASKTHYKYAAKTQSYVRTRVRVVVPTPRGHVSTLGMPTLCESHFITYGTNGYPLTRTVKHAAGPCLRTDVGDGGRGRTRRRKYVSETRRGYWESGSVNSAHTANDIASTRYPSPPTNYQRRLISAYVRVAVFFLLPRAKGVYARVFFFSLLFHTRRHAVVNS